MSTVPSEQKTIGALIDEISTEAIAVNLSTEAFIENLLSGYRAGETGGMELGPAHRKELSEVLGAGIGGPRELVDRVKRLATIQVDSTRIRLRPMLLERLTTRAREKSMVDFLKELVPEQLERYVGLR